MMPGSQISTVSSSIGSNYSRKYRTKSKESSVDETLFSRPIVVKEEPQLVKNKNAPLMARIDVIRSKPIKPDAVRLVTKDLVRDLVIPREDPSGVTVILDPPKYSQIMKDSFVKTKQDILKDQETLQMEKERVMLAAQKRKENMNKRDLHRIKSEKLSDLEIEAKKNSQHILEKAFAQRLEQEDDIKHLNELCLNAKCHAIRDAQVVEKRIVAKEYAEDEKRLDDMMEQDRINAIKTQEEMEEMRKATRYAGAALIMKQIEKKAEEKLQALEKKDQEGQQMLKYLEKLQREDLETMDIKRKKQKKLKKEMDKIFDEYQRQLQIRVDQDRVMDKKVIDFQKEKDQRETELEKEQIRIKREKEREIARLRDLQEKAIDVKSKQDALRAKRHSEQVEREWRRKERNAAEKKALVNKIMQKARTEQISAKHHSMAVEAQRERVEFERVLRELQRNIEKDRLTEENKRRIRLKHADCVRKQIVDKETIQLAERKAVFEEGIKMEEEARQRKLRLEAAKAKKLATLREAGVPDKYCREVERKIANPKTKLGT